MTSRPTKMKDPITATYSVLAQDVRGLNGHSRELALKLTWRGARGMEQALSSARVGAGRRNLLIRCKTRGMIVAVGLSKGATLCDGRRVRGATRTEA